MGAGHVCIPNRDEKKNNILSIKKEKGG